MSKATFIGTVPSQLWSDPANWQDGKVPQSSNSLHVMVDSFSIDDLGSATDPFVVHDIGAGIGSPTLLVTGFLQARDLNSLSVTQEVSGTIDVRSATNTAFTILGQAALPISGVASGDGGAVEIERNAAGSTFSFKDGAGLLGENAQKATLILDHPTKGSLSNEIDLPPAPPPLGRPPAPFSLQIELGGIKFDHADFIPSSAGSSSGDIQLSNGGKVVYNLTNVTGFSTDYNLSVGHDPATNYDYVSYTHA